ncbi:MAG: hypothetical protein AAGA48_06880 [Myxococcota bacterium]
MNEPHHLSKLVLDRYMTGELSPEEAAKVEAALDDRSRAHLEAIPKAKAELPALDIAALRARAAALPDESPTPIYDDALIDPEVDDSARGEPPEPVVNLASRRRPRVFPGVVSGLLLAAAVLIGVFGIFTNREASTDAAYAIRGGEALQLFVAQGGELHPYDPATPVGAGDVLGFRVVRSDHSGVVLLSVDGTGMISVFFPIEGVAPEPLEALEVVELPGTVMLDGAPGPEVFVAVFDRPADEAKALVRQTYWNQGHAGLRRLDAVDGVATAEVKRR